MHPLETLGTLGAVVICVLQAALIIGLLVDRAKRRRAEAEATLIAEISSKFVNLAPPEVDPEIIAAQRRICTLLDLDFSTLWQWSDASSGFFSLTHFYVSQAGPQPPDRMRQDQYPWAREQLQAGRIIRISSLGELPPEAARDRETLQQFGIKSNLALPLAVGGGPPIGILGFGTMRAERDWPDAVVERLQQLSRVFTHALARKRADQALRESEERMTLAAEAAEFGVWAWSLARNEVWGSERWLRLFGFVTGDDVTFEMIIQRIHPADRETVAREVRHALAGGSDYTGEFRVVWPDGTEHWLSSRGRGYSDTDKTTARMLGAAIDITERKKDQEALRASESRLATGAELAGLGYYEVDFSAGTCQVDRQFREICRMPTGEHQGLEALQYWLDHLHPDDRQRVLDEREKLHNGTLERLSIEYRFLLPDGSHRWLHHLAGVATSSTAGQAVRTFGVFRDVTEQRLAELEARDLHSKLAHADRVTLLGQLSSALAHELSQPLGAILRNAEAAEIMLRDPSPDLEELRAIIEDILADDQRASQVIEKLRALLKRRGLEPQPINIQEVVSEVVSLIRADAAARLVQLVVAAAPGLPLVRGDRIHLQQVLLNLLVNAMDALETVQPDRRAIRVDACRLGSNTVEVRISDTGPGISDEVIKRLFEPFFTTKTKGMGMGLPISKTIIEAHRGRLWAEHAPDGGACFCFTVPVAGDR